MKKHSGRNIGPGMMVTAAFIGPGTVTVCTLAGATSGYQLLWAVVFAIVATLLLQEMAARLAIVTRLDLVQNLQRAIQPGILRVLIILLIFSSIVIGNAAYEAGNISGGALGLQGAVPSTDFRLLAWVIGGLAFALLWWGSGQVIERALTVLVAVMSLSYLVTAIVTKPDLALLFRGLLVPSVSDQDFLVVLGVVGTTVVPYNLFLHSALATSRWGGPADLPLARRDTFVSIVIGGVISLCIVICGASIPAGQSIEGANDLAYALGPVYGPSARILTGLGLFAAGVTSSITAPLAAAYVTVSCFGWSSDSKSKKFRMVWASVLLMGVVSASAGFRPIEVIRFAQMTNGLVLPVAGAALIWLCHRRSVLGDYRNQPVTSVISLLLIGLVTLLGIKSIWTLL